MKLPRSNHLGVRTKDVARPGKTRSCLDGYAVKSSRKLKMEFYTFLKRAFYFCPNLPPLFFTTRMKI